MLHLSREHRFARAGLVFATLCALAACGGGGSDDSPTAVSNAGASTPATSEAAATSALDATLKAATTKLPVPRNGSAAPVDSAPDKTGTVAPPALDPAIVLATGFESGIGLSDTSGPQRGDRSLTGQDTGGTAFPLAFLGAAAADGNVIRARVDDPHVTDVAPWLTAGLVELTGPDNQPTRALALSSLAASGSDQTVALEYGHLPQEPVLYQRMRVKFDVDLLDRARALGPSRFFLSFWEAESADMRFRVKLVHSEAHGLVWQMKAETLNTAPWSQWTHELTTHPVVLANDSSPLGWHTVEIRFDRQGGQFRVDIDGHTIADRTHGLFGAQNASITTVRPVMVAHTPVATVRFDALEVRDSLPTAAP